MTGAGGPSLDEPVGHVLGVVLRYQEETAQRLRSFEAAYLRAAQSGSPSGGMSGAQNIDIALQLLDDLCAVLHVLRSACDQDQPVTRDRLAKAAKLEVVRNALLQERDPPGKAPQNPGHAASGVDLF